MIYYTLDGSTPAKSSTLYSSTISISTTTTLKAIAVKDGMTDSAVMTAEYTITLPNQVEAPAANPAAGDYTSAQSVTLTSGTEGAVIYYTTDGAPPTTVSSKYTAPIAISNTTTLKAIAVKDGMIDSEVLTAVYTITLPNRTVQFETNEGSPVNSVPVPAGGKITAPVNPTKSGFYFAGWYRNLNLTGLWDFSNDTVTSDMTLYAKWSTAFVAFSVADMETYLGAQAGGTNTGNPALLKVTMALGNLSQTAGNNWLGLLAALTRVGKYVTLDMGDCTITGTSFNHDNLTMVSGMDKIVDIILPAGITSIGDFAFFDCENLALTSLPSGITSIGRYAFHYCDKLALTELPAGITSIGEWAFLSCDSLALTSLPAGITAIGEGAFESCHSLALTELPDGITSIANNAFYECEKLASMSLPDTITSIGENAFYECENLTLTSLPSGLTSIGASAFEYCKKLVNISLPDGLISIGASAFVDCTNLATITIERVTPPTLGSDAFGSGNIPNLAIKVPAESVAAYKSTWSTYADKISAIEE